MVNPGWEAFEMHLHTRQVSPCASVDAGQQVRIYHEMGYAGVFITDHFTRYVLQPMSSDWCAQVDGFLAGYRAAREEGEKLGLKVFLGAELRFDQFGEDFLFYGADEDFFYQHRDLYALTLAQFAQLIRGRGYFLAQAHPFRPGNVPRDAQYLDGAELYNGHPGHLYDVPAATAWLWENGLTPISGSDSHDPGTQGRGGVCVPPGIQTSKDLVLQLKQGRHALIVPPGKRGRGPHVD